jgi:hypothetical protein
MIKFLSVLVIVQFFFMSAALRPATSFEAKYYQEQTNFTETKVPITKYNFRPGPLDICIYKDNKVSNSYYVWAKLSVQKWRQALREYTGNQKAWNITAHYIKLSQDLQYCTVKVYILCTYKDFPGYPSQSNAYTSIQSKENGNYLDIKVFLAPFVLHGDGRTEINLPTYAYRNTVVHEIGHVFGLGHMHSLKAYLMSPQFDFWQEKDQLPITTLELRSVINAYGNKGFS